MVAKRSSAATRCRTNGTRAAAGKIMDATRLAAICDKIDGYSAGGEPMNAKDIASICAMIHGGAVAGARGDHHRKRGRCFDSALHYKQMGQIGKGSFGVVVKAHHRETGRTVAMKRFRAPERDEEEPAEVGELLREACFLAACGGHPNLVSFHGVAHDPVSDQYSLVMEYVGPSLRSALNDHLKRHQGRAFPEADVRGVMRQLLAGADAMRRCRVIHRDIKPANIVLGGGGAAVKICDFGLAMSAAESRPDYDRVGTVKYMAPEMLTRMPAYDDRVDAWSLGCVMAELLSGEAPFEFREEGDDDDALVKLDAIFDVVGTPVLETFETFMPKLLAGKMLRRLAALSTPLHRARQRGRLREMFPSETLSQDGFDVLKGLLTCNPGDRLTAAAALRLPWCADTVDAGPASQIGDGASPFARVLNSLQDLLMQIALPLM